MLLTPLHDVKAMPGCLKQRRKKMDNVVNVMRLKGPKWEKHKKPTRYNKIT